MHERFSVAVKRTVLLRLDYDIEDFSVDRVRCHRAFARPIGAREAKSNTNADANPQAILYFFQTFSECFRHPAEVSCRVGTRFAYRCRSPETNTFSDAHPDTEAESEVGKRNSSQIINANTDPNPRQVTISNTCEISLGQPNSHRVRHCVIGAGANIAHA